MATKYTFTVRFLKNFFGPITIAMMLALTACTSEKNSDGGVISIDENEQTSNANGNNNQINIDSLVDVLRNQVTTPPIIDTAPLNQEFNTEQIWRDSVRNDSIQRSIQRTLDSIREVYAQENSDSTSNEERSQNVTGTLYAEDGIENLIEKKDIYGAFANQYSLMYKGFSVIDENDKVSAIPMPFPIIVANICDSTNSLCTRKKVMIKSWITDFTDTATVSDVILPDTLIYLSPTFNFNEKALIALTSPKQAQRQIKAYALENDKEILFYSDSKPVTIHPMQIFGEDTLSIPLEILRNWLAVWVTPWADSISDIVKEVAKKLPNGKLLVYQPYNEFKDSDDPLRTSTWAVINAVFEVLQSRNIKYVQDAGASGLIGQKINYPVETLRKKQGICIETAVLFASVLERLGYYTSIMLIPEHAFVGWLREPKEKPEYNDFDVVETTMIGDKNATFLDANIAGINRYYDPLLDESYAIGNVTNVPIYVMRALGILPNDIP